MLTKFFKNQDLNLGKNMLLLSHKETLLCACGSAIFEPTLLHREFEFLSGVVPLSGDGKG